MIIWRIIDGKPGHENQSAGLVEALARRAPVAAHDITPLSLTELIPASWGRLPARLVSLPRPDLLVGAGHATHPSLLALRRAAGGRALVLMRPSLPGRWFDLCVVPGHDPLPSGEVLVTRGVLNRVRPGPVKDPRQGLILVGGPSAHHGWNGAALAEQIAAVTAGAPARDWTVADSRRTPADFLNGLALPERVRRVHWQDTAPGWLPEQLATATEVWVTEDSVSMIHEALSAGAAVGLLSLPRRRQGRLVRGLDRLVADGLVTPFAARQAGSPVRPPAEPLDEAGRVANALLARWPELA